jgi:FxsC-like protein
MALRPGNTAGRWALYFFLSYAHSRGVGPEDRFEHDALVHRFEQDLDDAVTELASRPRGIVAGLSDRHIPIGGHWPDHLADALARCQSFIALYSSAYFDSVECGREWAAFTARMKRDLIRDNVQHEAIIPIMWLPVRPETLPRSVKNVQFTHVALGAEYNSRGLRYLMTHRELREHYQRAVAFFAGRVIEVAENDAPSVVAPVPSYESFPNAFADPERPASKRPRLRIVVAAPRTGRLPTGAGSTPYGLNAREWRPYLPMYTGRIVETARRLAESLGFQVFVEDAEHCRELLAHADPTAPTVLFVDPWAVQDPELHRRLMAFDFSEPQKLWVRLVIPWNRAGPFAADGVVDLDGRIDEMLGRTRERCRRETPRAVDGLESVEDLINDLPDVFRIAERQFLAAAETYPPQPRPGTPSIERPRLLGPRLFPDNPAWRAGPRSGTFESGNVPNEHSGEE